MNWSLLTVKGYFMWSSTRSQGEINKIILLQPHEFQFSRNVGGKVIAYQLATV